VAVPACLLPAACCLLPAACCLLPAACCLLPAACCLLPAACCLLRRALLICAHLWTCVLCLVPPCALQVGLVLDHLEAKNVLDNTYGTDVV
jgi:hypothetical protein